MLLTDKLKAISQQTREIRESLTDVRTPADVEFANEGRRQIRATGAPSRQVMALASMMSEIREGRRPDWHIREAMSTSDFPLLFGDLLYRQLLGNYVPYPTTYQNYFRIIDVKDFRQLNLYAIDGGQGLLEEVKEYAPYPETSFVETPYKVSVKKYGRRYVISFELGIQDDLGAFTDRPQLMAIGARRSEEWLATSQLVDVNGPIAPFFSAANKNLATGPLTIDNLQKAFTMLKKQTDKDGHPIVMETVHLVTTPGNEIVALNILNALQIRVNDGVGGGSASQFLYAENWMKNKLQLSINPYINYIATGLATEPWFLIASPSDVSQRPAFMFAFLRGRRQPQLWVKDPDAILLGGGDSSPLEGSFDNDAIDYKLRHIFGAAQGDPKGAIASFG